MPRIKIPILSSQHFNLSFPIISFTYNYPYVKLPRLLDISKYTYCLRRSTFLNLHWKKIYKLPSVHYHFSILYNYISCLDSLRHQCELTITLVVEGYENWSLVNLCHAPLREDSQLLSRTVILPFHVDRITTW